MKTLIFSDMDGTLLDHNTYDFTPTLPLINELRALQIPLILTTSKTKAEILWWQEKLQIHAPFICENGSALYIPQGYDNLTLKAYPPTDGWHCIVLGKKYDFITAYLASIANKYKITGFTHMDTQAISKLTNLNPAQAHLAKSREFSEPFIMDEPELVDILQEEAALYGLSITKGGRFFHCLGHGANKGAAMGILTSIYRRHDFEVHTIALGDSPNDLSMLQTAQTPIIIPNPSHPMLTCKDAIIAPHPGPKGWVQTIKEVLCL
jgi:mannosyl-3-phosphoglycerate phosphatase